MTSTILSSTFFLTLLLLVGLFFFIRAATKDRTETLQVAILNQPPDTLQSKLQAYFEKRAYRMVAADAQTHQTTFTGFVRPSTFLAIFLSFMAAVGSGCLALVLAILFPDYAQGFPLLLLLAPAAGLFYWRRAGREEQVLLTVVAQEATPQATESNQPVSQITVVAHRDELIALKQALSL